MNLRRKHITIALLFTWAAIIAGEYLLSPVMYPIQQITPPEFWNSISQGASVVGVDRGDFVIVEPGMEGFLYSRTPRADIDRDFPRIVAQLTSGAGPLQESDCAQAFVRWSELPAPKGAQSLLTLTQIVKLDRIRRDHPSAFPFWSSLATEARARIDKAHRYGLTAAFEIFWLCALASLLAYPFVREYSFTRLLICWSAVPLLFHLPYFLAFASQSIPGLGPRGGILYPWLIWFSGGTVQHPWEMAFRNACPPLLQAISQDSGPLDLTGFKVSVSTVGPLLTLYYTLAMAAISTLFHFACHLHFTRTRPRAFEVVFSGNPPTTIPHQQESA
jgi:hypothetical protein